MSHQDLKARMLAVLQKAAKGLVDSKEEFEFDAESAIWWFANDYHSGGGSELYQILSTSELRPGPSHRSVADEGEIAEIFYKELERKFIPKGKAERNPSRVRRNSNYAHQDAKLWTIVKIGRSKYHAIGRMPNGVMLWKGSGPTIYTMIENAQGEWGLGRYDNKIFAHPIAQQFSRLAEKIRKYVWAQQGKGSAITPAGIWRNPVRKNIFAFNNPGAAQRILAENFVKGANSGVASSMYIHGNRIYSYGPHFPIAERQYLLKIPSEQPLIVITNRKSPSKTTAGQIGLVKAAVQAAGMEVMYEELKPEAKGPAAYSNPGVRRNIFAFNNPKRPLNTIEQAAFSVGLSVATWAPGDGVTRYRFFKSTGSPYADYHQGDGLYTALGRKDAAAFISAFGKGRSARTNPKASQMYVIEGFTHYGRRGHSQRRAEFRTLSFEEARARAEQIFQETGVVVAIIRKNPPQDARRFISSEIGHLRRKGYAPKRAVAAAYSMARRSGFRVNPCIGQLICTVPAHPHGPVQNVAYGQRRSYAQFVSQKQAEYGPKFSAEDLAPQFIPYYESGQRIEVEFISSTTGKPYETKRGRVGVTTGWKPVFLLMLTTRSIGSAYTLGKKDRVVHVVRNPLTRTETIEIEHTARRERIMGEQIQSPGSRGYALGHSDGMRHVGKKYGTYVRPNPLLQTVLFANPPLSSVWPRLTHAQREELLEIVGIDRAPAAVLARSSWSGLQASTKNLLERGWYDTSRRATGDTTRRRYAPVGANPLTRKESAHILRRAREEVSFGRSFRPGPTRYSSAGKALARAEVVHKHGPKSARRAATKMVSHAARIMPNPGIRFPKPGTKLTVAEAMALARKIGDRDLIHQCQEAMRLQKKSNRGSRCVVWKLLPLGSKNRVDTVVALSHYGDSPEDMYKPPKGSKKGQHMYRHKWGEGSGRGRPVPVLAAPGGKAIIKVMGPGQKVGDWMRG